MNPESVSAELEKFRVIGYNLKVQTLYMAGILIVLSIFIALILSQIIVVPIKKLLCSIEKVASGDLTEETIYEVAKDEVGKLTLVFFEIRKNLRAFSERTTAKTNEVTNISKQLSNTSENKIGLQHPVLHQRFEMYVIHQKARSIVWKKV
ncbi:methyl-accepting chemotaxis protein [Halalkalibacter flavus]|uniref:methyl-accepting chemotaxis protein n=1 Tax=Halalkalibacter flavus TaxID=3090668 RepID=UPI002FC624C5